jgi:glycosyltransferase involved in cell wall biosynthesis
MSQPPAKISIVTPSFNQGSFIEEALLSVREQNYSDIEHIVVDGASTDATVEILRRFGRKSGWKHLRWLSEPDRGQTDALNKGFRMARGAIVGWLNSDDRYRPDCFETIAREFGRSPDVDILYGDYTWMNEAGDVKRIRREIEFSQFILSYHRVLYIPTVSTFFRRRLFDDGNWLDGALQYAMDYEFFLRLAKRGYRFRHVPSVLADFRWHAQNKSTALPHKQMEEHNAIAVNYSSVLNKLPGVHSQRLVLAGFRAAAAGLRYSRKLLRGYYFEQLRSLRGSGSDLVDKRAIT